MEILKYFNFIDYIITYKEIDFKKEQTLDDLMNIIKPEYWVKGSDYTEKNIRILHPSLKNIKLFINENNISSTILVVKISSL